MIEILAQVGADPTKNRDTVESLIISDGVEEHEDHDLDDSAVSAGVGVGILLTNEIDDTLAVGNATHTRTEQSQQSYRNEGR